jgi:nitrogen fixation protein
MKAGRLTKAGLEQGCVWGGVVLIRDGWRGVMA